MIEFSEVRGAVFDMDDTLLDNGPVNQPATWLHSRSRLTAIHQVAKEQGIPELAALTPEENGRAFITAKQHSLESAVWNTFYMRGLVGTNDIDEASPLFPVMKAIVDVKHGSHSAILREFGKPIPGSNEFIHRLARNGLRDHLAIATNAIKAETDLYLEMQSLSSLFPESHRITQEMLTHAKPHPQSFDLGFRSLGLPDSARRRVLAFEDNPRGLQSAKAAGLFVCAITTRLARDSPMLLATAPDLIADSYEEFAELLKIPS